MFSLGAPPGSFVAVVYYTFFCFVSLLYFECGEPFYHFIQFLLICFGVSVSFSSLCPPPPPHLTSAQPDELTNVLEICNIVFTSMFTLEMILKLTAFGFFEYLRNPYNIFDGIIVIIRCVSGDA